MWTQYPRTVSHQPQNHLKKDHPEQHTEVLAKEEKAKEREIAEKARRSRSLKVTQQMTLAESLKVRSVYSKDSERKKLAIFIGSSNVSNNVVENLEFRDFVNMLDRRYEMPGRGTISKEINSVN